MNKRPLITLLTDFGLSDAYVGTMKGIMLSICPTAHLVDLTHAIQPQNVRQAAYVLLTAFRHFPPDTVFLVVVDPGVGTARKPIAVHTDYGIYVAPNNGVLSYVLANVQVNHVIALENSVYHLSGLSATFHGRDIFSPVAAHLANGVPITDLGPTLPEFYQLDPPRLDITPNQIQGEVLHIDHFGNVITSIGYLAWNSSEVLQLVPQFGSHDSSTITIPALTSRITIGSWRIEGIRPTYGSVPPGQTTVLVGSSGQLEIGVNQGNAATTLTISLGDKVTLNY
jgi:S-adenosylmethionine hydrolase